MYVLQIRIALWRARGKLEQKGKKKVENARKVHTHTNEILMANNKLRLLIATYKTAYSINEWHWVFKYSRFWFWIDR